MSSPVELIKERLTITDVVGSYLKLEKSGANLKAKCPFHNERTASFFVSPARGSFYCFGCGAKGDIFSFVQAFEGLDFVGALRSLAARAGVELVREDPKVRGERERLFSLMETATEFFESTLSTAAGPGDYLKARGLSEETIRSWRLGFVLDAWRSCLDFCRSKGFSADELERAGLTKSEGGKTYDRFRSRIMFPIFDSAGRVLAFSGRIWPPEKESEHIPKYLNSPETALFSKSRTLYGFDRAKHSIRQKDYAILVEGQMDLLLSHQAGFTNAVASSGTAFTLEQLRLIKRLSSRLLMVFDADRAGIGASLKSAALALAEGMEVKVAALPSGFDPAELILRDKERFKECLRTSSHLIEFYLETILRENLDDRARARTLRAKLLPFVAALESSMEREYFVKLIAERAGVREEAIREDVRRVPREGKIDKGDSVQTNLSARENSVERLVVGLSLWQESLPSPLLDIAAFTKELGRILGETRRTSLFDEARAIADELVYQAESYYGGHASLGSIAEDLLSLLEEEVLKGELAVAMDTLSRVEREGDQTRKKEILMRCQELSLRLNALREVRYDVRR